MVADFRHAARSLRRSPGFTIAAITALAVGLGATTAVFTLVNAIILRPLNFVDADRVVSIGHVAPRGQVGGLGQSGGTYLFYREHNRVFDDLGVYYENVVNLTDVDDPERIQVAMMSNSIYSTLGVRPVVGRLFNESDHSGEVPVLISYELWQRRFGGDPNITQRTIGLNASQRRVIGVLPKGFGFPRRETQVWYPEEPRAATADVTDFHYTAIARLKREIDADDAARQLNQLLPRLSESFPSAAPLLESGLQATVVPLKDVVVGPIRSALWILLASMAVVLLISGANVANLMLVRAEHRRREIAVRLALGARASDLARLVNSESIIVVAAGGLLGALAAYAGVKALVLTGPANIPRLHEVGFDWRVVGFNALLCLLTTAVFGLAPLMRGRTSNLAVTLKSDGYGSTADRERQRVRASLVIAQVALAFTLLIASGLLVRSFVQLRNAEPGFSAERVLTVDIALPFRGYDSYDKNYAFWQRLLTSVRALPGVIDAGAGGALPLVPQPSYMDVGVRTDATVTVAEEALPKATVGLLTERYLESLRIPLIAGNYPTAGSTGERPVLLSAVLAARLFPNQNAVGQRIRRADARQWNVVAAVVGDVPRTSIGGDLAEIYYVPVMAVPSDPGYFPSHLTLTIRTSGEPSTLLPSVRSIIRELDRNLPLAKVRTMSDIVSESMARTSLAMVLLVIAGAAALVLGVVGLYAIIAYSVTRRTRELGIRIAIGATVPDLLKLVVGQAVSYAGIGAAIGLIAAILSLQTLRGLLYGVAPSDPLTILLVLMLLFGAAIAASVVPAWRAATVDPVRALKAE